MLICVSNRLSILTQDKLTKEWETAQDDLSEANSKISDLERKVKLQQDQILSLREEIAHLKTENR